MESEEESESGGTTVTGSSHPSISLVLEEMRNRYSDEEDRRRTVETKVGFMLTVDAIVISLIGSIADFSTVVNALIILPAVISAIVGLYILRPRDYARPGRTVEELPPEAKMSKIEFQEQSIFDYKDAVGINIERNNAKLEQFKLSFYLTSASLLIFIGGIIFRFL